MAPKLLKFVAKLPNAGRPSYPRGVSLHVVGGGGMNGNQATACQISGLYLVQVKNVATEAFGDSCDFVLFIFALVMAVNVFAGKESKWPHEMKTDSRPLPVRAVLSITEVSKSMSDDIHDLSGAIGLLAEFIFEELAAGSSGFRRHPSSVRPACCPWSQASSTSVEDVDSQAKLDCGANSQLLYPVRSTVWAIDTLWLDGRKRKL